MNSQSPSPIDSSPDIEVVVEIGDDAIVEAKPRSSRVEMKSRVGELLSERYRLDELIAEGGMGAVFRGEHVHMRKRVAVKLLRPETAQFPELVERFEREAIAGAHVDHPNVAAATDFGRLSDGSFFLVLEFVEGKTLRDRLRKGPVSSLEAVAVARQVAEALAACHAMGVVHRDVKPANVMLESASGRVKLVDFGLAKVPAAGLGESSSRDALAGDDDPDTRRSITLNGVVFGTVAYMAPEAEFGMSAVDHRCDLYALGVMLYEMLTGRHPFDAKALPELFQCHKTAIPPSFSERAPDRVISPALESITMRLLAKRRTDRYPDAAAVVAALDDAMAEPAHHGPPQAGQVIVAESTFEPVIGRTAPSLPAATALGTAAMAPSAPSKTKRNALAWIAALGVGALVAAAALAPHKEIASARRIGPILIAAASSTATHAAAVERAPSPSDARANALAALHDAADARVWSNGADALLDLAALHADDLAARDVAPAASVALALAFADSPKTTQVFDALAFHLGAWGVDVLYDVSSKHGGARAAKRADDLLASDAVRGRATPALRVALELRDARCEDKPSSFGAVSREGDERGLRLLERLRGMNCSAARCCYLKNRALESSISETKARLANR